MAHTTRTAAANLRNVNRSQVARAIGVKQPYVSLLLSGQRDASNLRLGTAHRMARHLGISLDTLYRRLRAVRNERESVAA